MKAKFVVLDIEVFKQFFCIVITDFHTLEKVKFRISKSKNEYIELITYLNMLYTTNKLYVITFNGNNYDNVVINYMIKNYFLLKSKDYLTITKEIHKVSDNLIKSDKIHNSNYKSYSYNLKYQSIDLMCFWALLTIKSKKLSLKFFAISLDLSVEECPIHWNKIDITPEEEEIIITYCENDVFVTYTLAQKLKPKINFRIELQHKKNLNCLSWSEVKIGSELLIKDVARENNIEEYEIRKLGIDREFVKLNEIIANDIVFLEPKTNKHWQEKDKVVKGKVKILECFDTFTDALDYLKTLTVYNTKSIAIRVRFKNVIYDIKSGGLHSFHLRKEIVKKQEGYIYIDEDVSSWYPTLGSMKEYVPEDFKKLKLAKILQRDKEDRVRDKKAGRILEAEIKKLKLNGGFYGNTNNPYSPFRDWKATLQITLNGQLYLLKNVEMQTVDSDIVVDMCNTDGISYIIKESKLDSFMSINKEWEELTISELEYVNYELVARNSVNHYVAFYYDKDKLKTKEKGFYVTQPDLISSKNFLIIPITIIEYLKQKYFYNNIINIEEFVKSHSNMYNFCSSVKVDKQYQVIYNAKNAQHLNRYYVSNNGTYLFKKKKGKNIEAIIKDIKVSLLNKQATDINDNRNIYDIDYKYYIKEVNKIISELEITNVRNVDNLLLSNNNQIRMF